MNENDEIRGLRAAVEALRLECAELRAVVEQRQQTGQDYDSDLLEAVMFRAPTPDEAPRAPGEAPPRRPFDVWYDFTDEEWKIYLPSGCVTVNGSPAGYSGNIESGGWTPITPAGTIYCHVSENGVGTWSFSLDGNQQGPEGSRCDVPVARFSSDGKEVVAQYVAGCLYIYYPYVPGDDTNIVFTPVTSGPDKGKVKVDVYYL